MSNQSICCLRPNFSAQKSLHHSLLLLILLWTPSTQAAQVQASDDRSTQSLPQQQAGSQNAPEVTTLELGKAVERQLSGGQKHNYQIELAEGEYASVELDSRGVSATISLFDATGEVITLYNADPNSPGKETIELVAEATGRYRLDVEGNSSSAPAQTYAIRLTAISPAPEKELWRHQARRLSHKANALIGAGKYDEALVMAEKALPLREKALGPDHIGVANSLQMLANIHFYKGDYPKAELLFLRAIGIWEKTSGPASSGLFRNLINLGAVYSQMGDLDKAEQFMQRGLEIQEKLAGADHPSVATVLNNLAITARAKGDNRKAEALYERALAIREKALGPNDLQVAGLLTGLSALYQELGDYVKAESLAQRALDIFEKTLGSDHPSLADPLINLGNVRYLAGDLEKAEILYQRALDIAKKALGPEHPTVALALSNLGEIYRDRRDFAKAETLYLQALAIQVKKLGEKHSRVAFQLNNLGNLYRDQGDYSRAESFYKRALTIREQALGPEHPDVVNTLGNTALMHMASGRFEQAALFQSRAIAITERNANLNLLTGSERQKLAYLDLLSEQIHRVITLNVSFAPDQAAVRDLAITTVLQRKGRVRDALSDNLAALRHRVGAEDAELLDRFNNITSQLARLVLGGPKQLSTAEHQKQVDALKEKREDLEAEISRRSAEFRAHSRAVTIESVRAAVPENAALLEFVAYKRFLPKGITPKERYGESRYVVYIVRHRGDVQWKDLGEATAIDQAIDRLRRALRDPKRDNVKQLARTVDEKVMQPVRALVGNTTQLLISPDGELNLIPFEALVDEKGRYLVEHYAVAYVTSGRDLLRMQVARESKGKLTVLANPLFGEPMSEQFTTSARLPAGARNRRRSVTAARNLSETYFAPLRGTAQEALSIMATFPDATLLTGLGASESALKHLSAPNILHIATHGFFLEDRGDSAVSSAGTGQNVALNVRPTATTGNPLLRSGLALAGANLRSGSDGDDGILTALEASGLNLWGTKLVVLSACDTGVGEVRNGEGVYGLRRAFVLAGAESLVMSLWPVSDYATRKLMTSYYKNLKLGMGRGEALRQVQLSMIRLNKDLHPFYWANFIQSGEWANLDGKR
jgi:CHAT domain-containing protein/Tfp pilus assembly protein PilF